MTPALASLNAELRSVTWEGGERTEALWFVCPMCDDHVHIVPFRHGQPSTSQTTVTGRNVWGHTGGSTVADLTLAPSYLARAGGCRLHAFIRDGHLQVLADSHPPKAGA